MIVKIVLVSISVKACLWKRRFKLMYAEGIMSAFFETVCILLFLCQEADSKENSGAS